MTNKEYAAQLLVEAAGILNETESYDPIYEAWNELINECYNLNVDATDLLYPMNESGLPSVKDIKGAIKNGGDKVKELLKNIQKWYYKVEPKKKFKVLRYVIRAIGAISYLVVPLVAGGALGSGGVAAADTISKKMANNVIKKNIKSPGIIPSENFEKVMGGLDKVHKAKTAVFAGSMVLSLAASVLMGCVVAAIKTLSDKTYYNYNIKDYEANMKELQEQRAKIAKVGGDTKDWDRCITELKRNKAMFDRFYPNGVKNRLIHMPGANKNKSNNESAVLDSLYNSLALCESAEEAAYILKSINAIEKGY